MTEQPMTRHWIGGEWVSSARTSDSVNPATGEVFDTEEEAIALANHTDYGFSACIWSRDADRTVRVARQLDADLISVNSWANLTVDFNG